MASRGGGLTDSKDSICSRTDTKAGYSTQREVNAAIAHVVGRARRRDRGSMHGYRCHTCGRWHIGISMFMPGRDRRGMMQLPAQMSE
jgi:hypothetical protein